MNIIPFKEAYKCDSITLNITNNCNLNCTYCFEHNKNREMMPSKVAIDAVDAAYNPVKYNNNQKFTINIFGGEPLLNWQCFKDLIDHCNEKEYEVSYGVTTNLTGLTDEMIQYFDDNGVMLLVSCDGIRSVHNKNRCNSWDRVINNINRLKEAGLTLFIEIRMTILPEDVPYAMDGVKMFVDMGIDNICPMVVTDVEWTREQLNQLEKFYMELNEFYVECLNKDWDRNIAIKNADDALMNVMSPYVDDPIMCPIYRRGWCCIDYKGDVYPCHQLPTSSEEEKEKQRIGNIYTGVDNDILKDDDIIAKYPYDYCTNCLGKAICKAGCIEENLRMTGNMMKPSKAYCDTKIALVRAIRMYQNKLLYAENIRSRQINILIANLKIRKYLDTIFKDLPKIATDRLILNARISHVKEMISNLGEDKILPTFNEYFNKRMIEIISTIVAANDLNVEKFKKSFETN